MRAVERFGLTYQELKTMVRHSLEYSFLDGGSLWGDAARFRPAPACAADRPGNAAPSTPCRRFLDGSARARLQWKLEAEFIRFEKQF